MDDSSALVEVVQRRLDFLETLSGGAFRKHELVDEIGCSRSTVNRAIDELEAESLVTRETDGYRTTLTGRLLASSYRDFLTAAADVDDTREVLSPLGATIELSPVALRNAETYRAAGPDPYRPLERLDSAVVDATVAHIAVPTLPYPRLLDRLRDLAGGEGAHTDGTNGTEPAPTNEDAVTIVLADTLYRHARTRFPADIGTVASSPGVTVATVNRVDVGLVVTDEVCLTLVFDDDGGLHGITESTDPTAIEWARGHVRSLAGGGDDVTGELADLSGRDGVDAGASGFIGRPAAEDGASLTAQGFSVLDDDRLTGKTDPTAPLRASPSFTEVAAGHVLERTAPTPDGDGRLTIAERLVEGLDDGTDHALIGPPGSGKSTVSRDVAVRWHRSGRGPVLYRRGDAEGTFTAVETLRERVAAADGHVLVVVEDAVDPEAARTVTVARRLAERPDVSFLFDAREATYDDPDDLSLSPADLAYRREIETVRMPRLDKREVERFIEHVDTATNASLTADPTTLLETVGGRGGDGGDDSAGQDSRDGQGEVSRLVHRLAYSVAPIRGDSETRSALEDEVARAVRELAGRPDPTMDVATLLNLLNVAGVDDVRSLAYALLDGAEGSAIGSDASPDPDASSDPDTSTASRTGPDVVQRALERLKGTVLVPAPDGSTRLVHEEWSVLFLERLLERSPEPVVARRVGRVVTRLLSLADNAAKRSRIRRALGGDAPAIDEIERDPAEWATTTARTVYGVGREYPRLAGLYGRVRYSWIDLPEACPDTLRDRPPEWITRMYIDAGDLERATEALDAWRPASAIGEAKRQRGFGDVARRRGEHDVAMDHFDCAAELFDDADDQEGLAAAVRGRGQAAHFAGDYETAYEANSRAYAIAAALGDPIAVAKSLMLVANALDAMDGGETVIAHYRYARELFRAYDDVHGAANVSANLGVTYRRRGDLSAARRAGRRALNGYRTVGDTHRETIVLSNLGVIAEQRGQTSRARQRYREVESLAERVGAESNRGMALSGIGSTALAAGELDRAERHFRDALAAFEKGEEGDADHRRAMVLTGFAEVALERGDLDEADRMLDRVATLLEGHAGLKRTAELGRVRGMVSLERGGLVEAESLLSDALEAAESGGFTGQRTEILAALGTVAAEQGDDDLAIERLTEALTEALAFECARATVAAAERLSHLLADRDADTPDTIDTALDTIDTAPDHSLIDGTELDAETCRRIAARWRMGGGGDTGAESEGGGRVGAEIGSEDPDDVAGHETIDSDAVEAVSESLSGRQENPEHER